MQKIILIGCPGSGKTTLANRLGKIFGIPVYHLDKIIWQENFQSIPYQEFLDAQEDIFLKDAWIIDGNFTKSIPRRLEEADTVIFFDLPRVICLWRLVKRYVQYFNTSRPDMGGNNKDKLGFKFLKFVLTYPRSRVYEMLRNLPADTQLHVIKNTADLRRLHTAATSRS